MSTAVEEHEIDTAKLGNRLATHGVIGADAVDRENAVIRGRVVAELGPFKSDGRGEFDMNALEKIVELGNAHEDRGGLKSRFRHPNLSDDGLGKFLGRDRNFRLVGTRVLSDFHLNATSLDPPPGAGGTPYGVYVMNLAESDPAAFSSSLNVPHTEEDQRHGDGSLKKDAAGHRLPPLWRPTELLAIDVVDTGDAVNDFLSADKLPDAGVRHASNILDSLFANKPAAEIRQRGSAFLERYLSNRFGGDALSGTPSVDELSDTKESVMSDAVTKQQLDELKAENATILAQQKATNDALAAIGTQLTEERAENAKAAAAETRRAKIHILGTEAGYSADDVAKFVADDSLSLEAFRDQAWAKMRDSRQLSSGDGAGGDGDVDKDESFRREFRERKKLHSKLGVTEDEYVAQRRVEDGIDEQPDLLSLAAARSKQKTA